MSPRDANLTDTTVQCQDTAARTQAEKASAKLLALLRKYHPAHDPQRQAHEPA